MRASSGGAEGEASSEAGWAGPAGGAGGTAWIWACEAQPALFDTPGLQGPLKHAELVVKLGYWLALDQMTAADFREWVERIPAEDNSGWDVDLCARRPGSALPHILKMGLHVPSRPVGSAAEG